ncbi:MAG: PilZ domain-containing protein [Rhizobiaceae bacterium]|nr:PilZ domain-containing protein [Rhizobiaceae bacterium]
MDKDNNVTGVSSLPARVSSRDCGTDANNPNTNSQTTEARAAVRQRVLKSAMIDIGENFAKIPCRIRNVSETGALIDVEANYVVPDKFTLSIPMDGLVVECEVVRRHHTRIGLQYIGEKIHSATKATQCIRASSDPHVEKFIRKDNYWVSSKDETDSGNYQSDAYTGQFVSKFGKRQE